MKAKDFISALRKVIREEVRTAVREEMKQVLNEQRQLQQRSTPVSKPQQRSAPATKSALPKNHPVNSMVGGLAEILKETAMSMQSSRYNDDDEWPEMGRTLTSADAQGAPMMMQSYDEPIMDAEESHPAISDGGIDLSQGADTAMFIKDYSKLLRAADEKAQGMRGF